MKISISNLRSKRELTEPQLLEKIRALKGFEPFAFAKLSIIRLARDLRKRNQPVFCYTVQVETANLTSAELNTLRLQNKSLHINPVVEIAPILSSPAYIRSKKKVLVVGAGPAGYFAALRLAEYGFPVALLERGKAVEERDKDVAELSMKGLLNLESNICFGEGGAGTYSDGKLMTRKHDPTIRRILEIFVEFGAPASILISNRPHIGTDILRNVVRSFRKKLVSMGVEIMFGERVEDLTLREGLVSAVRTPSRCLEDFSDLVLAIGHSARDTYRMLHEKGFVLEAKPFALGVRCEHPQSLINKSQHGEKSTEAAEYRLVHNISERRSVYSFCMCPGGAVVCSAAQKEHLAVNGMSNSRRSGPLANAALVVKVDPGDYPSTHVLSGLEFQERIEQAAFAAGGGAYLAPAQRITDFLARKISADLPKSTYRPGVTCADLNSILPEFAAESLRAALPVFERKIRGFTSDEALLIGVETKTSAPVRIPREDNGCAQGLANIYPAGEGAGYAGGIVSSALDGMRCADRIRARHDSKT